MFPVPRWLESSRLKYSGQVLSGCTCRAMPALSVPVANLRCVTEPTRSTRRSAAGQLGHDYEARHLLVLEGMDAVRKRPGMYVGSNGTPGLMHCLWEIIDNSVDEALAGFGDRIEVELRADGSVMVADHARGIPVDIHPGTGLSGVEVVFTKLHGGGKFGGGSYNAVACTGLGPRW